MVPQVTEPAEAICLSITGNLFHPHNPGDIPKAPVHHFHGLRIVIHQYELAAEFQADSAGGAAASEEIQHGIAGVGRGGNHATEYPQRFLGGVAGLFLAVGGDDGVPPGIRRQLAERGFGLTHQAGRHVRNAVDGILVEGVVFGIFDIQQDVVMLGRPAVFRPAAVVIRPDDLVQEALPPEDGIQQDFAVMHLAVVNVEIQAARWFEQTVRLAEARFEEGQVIVKDIGIPFRADLDGLIAPSAEAGAIAIFVLFRADLRARLGFAGVERRIDVDQVNR